MPLVTCADLPEILWEHPAFVPAHIDSNTHLWQIPALDPEIIPCLLPLLDTHEQQTAATYHFPKDRTRYIISHGLLRWLLGKYLNVPPAGIAFQREAGNKPFVMQNGQAPVHYNMAHAGALILIAVSYEPLGIDLEQVTQHADMQYMLQDFFSEEEQSRINNNKEQSLYFHKLWTRKEALVKATGKGTDDDLRQIPCLNGRNTVSSAITLSEKDWKVDSFQIDNFNYAASIAHNPIHDDIKFFDASAILNAMVGMGK